MPSTKALSSKSNVRVSTSDGFHRLVAGRAFAAGDTILRIDGIPQATPSRYSVQVGPDEHIERPAEVTIEEEEARYQWRFLNHACEPNAMLVDRDLRALRPIRRGEEITFDYLTNEFDMATPFRCACGSAECHGDIRGFRHLRKALAQRLAPRAAPHVIELAKRHGLL
jgi:SET domain